MLTTHRDGNLLHLSFDDGRANVLGSAALRAFLAAADDAARADAVLITGRPKVFSAGLDLKEVGPMDQAALAAFMDLFHAMFRAWFAVPRPVVTCAEGSAVAGGAILLCTGDLRIGPEGGGHFGVNETRLGLSFPVTALEVVLHALGPANASRALVLGEVMDAPSARGLGFFTELHATPTERAWERLRDVATCSGAAVAETKAMLKGPALQRIDAAQTLGAAQHAPFVAAWTGADARQRIAAALSKK